MSDQASQRDVDLTTDDDTEDAPVPDDPSVDDEETDAVDSADEFDAREEGKLEAKRLLKQVDGSTEAERAEIALNQKQQSLQNFAQERQQTATQLSQIDQRIDGLSHTISRLEDADDETPVFQQLEGGVTIAVPPDEREDVRENIASARETLEEQHETLTGRLDAIKRGVEKSQVAIAHLENLRDLLTDE